LEILLQVGLKPQLVNLFRFFEITKAKPIPKDEVLPPIAVEILFEGFSPSKRLEQKAGKWFDEMRGRFGSELIAAYKVKLDQSLQLIKTNNQNLTNKF
jgi:hypothetical protein